MRFPKDNTLMYGQDMGFHRGIPSDVEFAQESCIGDRIQLIAPGYGGEPYGNGAIYVDCEVFHKAKDSHDALAAAEAFGGEEDVTEQIQVSLE